MQATYTDGTQRDVTQEAFVESGNIEVIEANGQGLLTMLRRGESPVLVRYEGAYAATTLTVMGDRSEFVWQQPPTNSYIDEWVYDKLKRVKILPSDSHSASADDPGKNGPVPPTLPQNSRSPVINLPSKRKQKWPGEWPGVCRARTE